MNASESRRCRPNTRILERRVLTRRVPVGNDTARMAHHQSEKQEFNG